MARLDTLGENFKSIQRVSPEPPMGIRPVPVAVSVWLRNRSRPKTAVSVSLVGHTEKLARLTQENQRLKNEKKAMQTITDSLRDTFPEFPTSSHCQGGETIIFW